MAVVAAHVFSTLSRRVAELEPAVRAGGDSEALHDMRVAVRRARAALRVFGPFLPAARVKAAARDLRKLGRSLGPARDSDVLVGNVRQRFRSLSKEDRLGVAPVVEALQRERLAAHAALKRFLAGPRSEAARAHLRQLARPSAGSGPPVGDAAPGVIAARIDEAEASLARVRRVRPPVTELHDLRIRLKELRYALEFLGSALGPGVSQVLQQLREAQDELGAIQDTVVEESRVLAAAKGLPPGAAGARASRALLRATRRERNLRLMRAPELVAGVAELLAKARALTSR